MAGTASISWIGNPAPVGVSFVSYTDVTSGFGTNSSPRSTASISVNNGDTLVAVGAIEGQALVGAETIAIAGGGLVWNNDQYVNAQDFVVAYSWSTTATSTTSFTVTFTRTASNNLLWWGGGVYVFRNSTGIGATNKTNVNGGAPTLSLNVTANNSTIVTVNGDWSAQDGTSRTWNTINSITPTIGNGLEKIYFRNSSHYSAYSAYWNDVGASGSKSTGISAPGSQKYSIISVEVKGS